MSVQGVSHSHTHFSQRSSAIFITTQKGHPQSLFLHQSVPYTSSLLDVFNMCFTLIRAALLADRIHTRQQEKQAAAQQQQQQQQQYQQQQQPYANPTQVTGVVSTDKPYQPQPTVTQVS